MVDVTFRHPTPTPEQPGTPTTADAVARAGYRHRPRPVATWLPVRHDDGRVRMEMIWTMSDPRRQVDA